MTGAAKFDPYAALGLARDASVAAVRSAFRQAAKTAHPDTGGSRAAFDQIQRANLVLLDPKRRAHYDRTGEIDDEAPADQTEQMALGMISQLLSQAIAGDADPFTLDIPTLIVGSIKAGVTKLEEQLQPKRRERARTHKMLNRFKRKASKKAKGKPEAAGVRPEDGKRGQDNIFQRMLEWRLRELDKTLEQGAQQKAVHERAMQLASEYDFERDPPPRMTATMAFGGETFRIETT